MSFPSRIRVAVSISLCITACAPAGRLAPAAGVEAAPVRSGVPAATAFVDVSVVPMDTDRIVPHQTVVVANGRIAAMGPVGRVRVPQGAVRVDGTGKYLVPGLADMHVHLNSYRPFGNLATRYDTADAERRLLRWVARGVTTIRNMDFMGVTPQSESLVVRTFPSDSRLGPNLLMGRSLKLDPSVGLYLRERVAAGQLPGPRIYTSGQWGPYTRLLSLREPTPPEIVHAAAIGAARAVAAYKAAGYDFIKVHDEPPEVLDSLAAAARRVGIPLVGHMEDSNGLARALQLGYRSVEHLSAYRDVPPSDSARREAAAITRRAGLWNCPTVATLILAGGQSPAMVRLLQDAGAPLLLGSDMPMVDGAIPELEALVKVGLTPYQALVAGTRNVARFFGTLDRTGTIAVGKRADLVLVDGNPLEDVRHMARPLGVVLAGRWLPRAELARLLAVPTPSTRDRLYWRMAKKPDELYAIPYPAWQVPDLEPDVELPGFDSAPSAVHLPPWLPFLAQYTGVADSSAAVHRELRVLIDSLVRASASTDSASWVRELHAGRRRVLECMARQLRVARAGLRADQRGAFDEQARAVMQQWAREGYPVVIPGV